MTFVAAQITPAVGVTAAHYTGAGTRYVVEANNGDVYDVYVDNNSDVAFRKSTDGGLTWGTATVVFAGTVTQLAIWFDRWSGIAAGLIHLAYTESAGDDILYRTIDTENSDALSTQTTILAAGSTATGGALSITRARGGNVFCMGCIDAGAESITAKLVNANVPNGAWSAALTAGTEAATTDQWILLPGWAADNQDIMCFFWDADVGADEISRKLYDDSANSWSETSIATGMLDGLASTAFPHFAAAVDITNSRNLLVAWSAVDTANADLRCWHVTESAITEVTNVVLNATSEYGLCAIGIDTDTEDWHVYYARGATWATQLNVYRKISTDDGATWGAELQLTPHSGNTLSLSMTPRFTTKAVADIYSANGNPSLAALIDVTPGSADSDRAATLVNGALVQ